MYVELLKDYKILVLSHLLDLLVLLNFQLLTVYRKVLEDELSHLKYSIMFLKDILPLGLYLKKYVVS